MYELIGEILHYFHQNEEERDENEEMDKESDKVTTTTVNKFNVNEMNEDKLKMIDQNNRPKDLPSLSSNHIITSPTNSNSNAVWNTDSWADGDFEPLEEHSGEGKYSIKL